MNAYELNEDGTYTKCEVPEGQEPFDIHKRFFAVNWFDVMQESLFEGEHKEKSIPEIHLEESEERSIADI